MANANTRVSRRALGSVVAAVPILSLSGHAVSAAQKSKILEPTTTQGVRERLPVLARHEGVWDGTFMRLDANNKVTAEFKSRIIKRFLPDEFWPEIYHQTNMYEFADGTTQVIDTKGEYREGKIHFGSERVDGWQLDDATDPHNRTVFLYMVYKSNPNQYVYELINISEDGQSRTRITQFLEDGKSTGRTLIDETLVSRDWSEF